VAWCEKNLSSAVSRRTVRPCGIGADVVVTVTEGNGLQIRTSAQPRDIDTRREWVNSSSPRYSIGAGVSKHDCSRVVHESVAAGLGDRGPVTLVLSGDHK